MAAVRLERSGSTPTARISASSASARRHWRPSVQVDMHALYVLVVGTTPATRISPSSDCALAHSPRCRHEEMAALYDITSGCAPGSQRILLSRSSARSDAPPFEHAEMALLYVIVLGAMRATGMTSSSATACCHLPLFAQAEMALLYETCAENHTQAGFAIKWSDVGIQARRFRSAQKLSSGTHHVGCHARCAHVLQE